MIRFFHAPSSFVLPENVRFPELRFSGSSGATRNKIIPFSHIYMTSASQLSHLLKYGGQGKLVTLPEKIGHSIFSNNRCPIDLSFCDRGIESLIQESGLKEKTQIKVAILNGMGRGYGDNVVGLGVLQHFRNYLEDNFAKVEIDILQRNKRIQSQIYLPYAVVDQAVQLPVSVTRFFNYDAFVDLSDLLANPLFDELPLYDFFLHGLSLQNLVSRDEQKRTYLHRNPNKIEKLRSEVQKRAGNSGPPKPIVLLHPSASTPLRSIPKELLTPLVNDLVKEKNTIIICCVPEVCPKNSVVDLSDLSGDINQFFDVIASADAVITVGTVVYHVSGSLDIPTLLIPTVQADINSARYLPSVQCFLPKKYKENVSLKHMSREESEIARIRPIWESLSIDVLRAFLRKACISV